MTSLYIAGPMTGLPEHNFPAFNAAEVRLQQVGYSTMNPARHGANDPSMTWSDYMRRDIADLLTVDGIALLDDWEASRGARLEVHIAQQLGIDVRQVSSWVEVAA